MIKNNLNSNSKISPGIDFKIIEKSIDFNKNFYLINSDEL